MSVTCGSLCSEAMLNEDNWTSLFTVSLRVPVEQRFTAGKQGTRLHKSCLAGVTKKYSCLKNHKNSKTKLFLDIADPDLFLN